MTSSTLSTAVMGLLLTGLASACAGAGDGSPPLPSPKPQSWASSSQSTVPLEMLRFFEPDAEHCLETRTCPFEGASVPTCQSLASDPATLENVGRKLRVRGRLQSALGRTTQMNCSSHAPCCNRVHGLMSLITPEGRVTLSSSDGYNDAEDSFVCVGDVSAVCCGFAAMGEEVIAEGTLLDLAADDREGVRVHERYLHVAGLCRTNGVNHKGTNLTTIGIGHPKHGPG